MKISPGRAAESFQLAAAEHDNGWNEWEFQPRIDPLPFCRYSFMSLPTQEHIDLYQRGIERVVKVDRTRVFSSVCTARPL